AKTRTFRVELEVPNPARTIVQGVSAELHLPVADLPAHRVSPAILTLAENGDVGVKTIGPGNIVEFHPVTIVSTGADGVWLGGVGGRGAGDGDVHHGGTGFRDRRAEGRAGARERAAAIMNAIIDFALGHSRTVLSALVLLIVAGIVAYIDLPKESDPNINIPV